MAEEEEPLGEDAADVGLRSPPRRPSPAADACEFLRSSAVRRPPSDDVWEEDVREEDVRGAAEREGAVLRLPLEEAAAEPSASGRGLLSVMP